MSECDPTETESCEPGLDTGATAAVSALQCVFRSLDPPKVLFDRNGIGLGPVTKLGGAVRISDSCESVLTELETDGSGEETLLLPCSAGSPSSSSPRGVGEKWSRRNRRSSSSDKDALASAGKYVGSTPLGIAWARTHTRAAKLARENPRSCHVLRNMCLCVA